MGRAWKQANNQWFESPLPNGPGGNIGNIIIELYDSWSPSHMQCNLLLLISNDRKVKKILFPALTHQLLLGSLEAGEKGHGSPAIAALQLVFIGILP